MPEVQQGDIIVDGEGYSWVTISNGFVCDAKDLYQPTLKSLIADVGPVVVYKPQYVTKDGVTWTSVF